MSGATAFLRAIGVHLLDCGQVVTNRKMLEDNLTYIVENLYQEMSLDDIRSALVELFQLSNETLASVIDAFVAFGM